MRLAIGEWWRKVVAPSLPPIPPPDPILRAQTRAAHIRAERILLEVEAALLTRRGDVARDESKSVRGG